jgi:diguanylate cyclase (GGDEF)-like protein
MSRLFKQTSLLFWLSGILITGFLATSILSYLVSARVIRRSITDQALPLTGDNVYSEIQKDIVRPIFISSQMANNTFLKDWVIRGETDQAQVLRYLQQVKQEHKTITAFLISEETRKYYYADGLLKVIKDDEPRDRWFFRARSIQEPFETNVDIDLANRDTLTIFINYRMMDYQGKFLGITGVGLTLSNAKQVIETAERRFNRRIYFVDRTGNVVLSGQSMARVTASINDMPGVKTIAPQILQGAIAPLSLKYQTAPGWGASTIQVNSRYIPELKWFLIVEQNENDAIKPLWDMLLVNVGMSTIATIVMLSLIVPTVRRYQHRLEKVATTDALTGLLNRQACDRLFSDHRQLLKRGEAKLAAILFDVDHFKQINDHYGHITGDIVLKTIADIARETLRHNDWIVRWGGEEFLVLLPDCGLEEAYAVAEKLRQAIADYPFSLDREARQVTISVGLGQYQSQETTTNFLHRIDQALYLAKQNGRNRVEREVVLA